MNVPNHPSLMECMSLWETYRDTYKGGRDFINKYLKKFSALEGDADFVDRRDSAYCPAHAKSALIEIRNSIYQRTSDVIRIGGPDSYRKAIIGEDGGVDLQGHTMNDFIGSIILEELLVISRVGIYVDKPEIPIEASKYDTKGIRPYVYHYPAENVLNWLYNAQCQLIKVFLKEQEAILDPDFGLTVGYLDRYRFLQLTPNGVTVELFDENMKPLNMVTLELSRIPFIMPSISHSILEDIADYQIGLLQLASSDLNYAVKSNFPFYTEQYVPGSEYLKRIASSDGSTPTQSTPADVALGPLKGRRYPKDLERPQFVHPSPEPLMASMSKQEKMRQEIRELVQLSVAALGKEPEDRGLEAGLSYIGLELQYAEQQMAEIWAEYEGSKEPIAIKYPRNYSLRTEEDCRLEAKDIQELSSKVPSQAYQKAIAKRVVDLTVGHKLNAEELEDIYKEIEAAPVVVSDPEVIRLDIEAGLVGVETASKARGYPEGEVEKAKQDHADRAARIALAQSEANQSGVADMNDPKREKNQKEADKENKSIGKKGDQEQ